MPENAAHPRLILWREVLKDLSEVACCSNDVKVNGDLCPAPVHLRAKRRFQEIVMAHAEDRSAT
jgi:hypothetical protein